MFRRDSRLPRARANSPQRCLPFRAYYHQAVRYACSILSARFRESWARHSRDHLSDRGLSHHAQQHPVLHRQQARDQGYGRWRGGRRAGRPEHEYAADIHAGIALITLGCLAMVVSIVLSFFAATSKRKMDDRGEEPSKSTRTVFACLIVMNAELFMSAAAGCMELLYRPLIQDEHRLHNMECAIAVFNIVIYAMYVVTMVLTPTVLKEKQDEVPLAAARTPPRSPLPQTPPDNRFYYSSRGSGNPYYSQSSGSCERASAVAASVIESAGAIELFRNPPVAIPRNDAGRESDDDKSRRDDRRPPEEPALAGAGIVPRDRRGKRRHRYPPGACWRVRKKVRMEIARPYPAWSARCKHLSRSTVIPVVVGQRTEIQCEGFGGACSTVFWLTSPVERRARVRTTSPERRPAGYSSETTLTRPWWKTRWATRCPRRWSWIPLPGI
ncbi:hypothetical protein Q5P01_000231 [Channa striata]|uniref:Uncharacterized protein n=1 Tax=Channa striata TaxID=64152 RepID=A0AA88IHA9_CHASR|nr:hypothetical protein Q5P01_000231 [Channa striata]